MTFESSANAFSETEFTVCFVFVTKVFGPFLFAYHGIGQYLLLSLVTTVSVSEP